MIIIGVDPGSNWCGYGLIQAIRQKAEFIACGRLTLRGSQVERLHQLDEGLRQIVIEFNPEEVAFEKVFVNTNPHSSLKLGEARGVAIHASTLGVKPFFEYATNHIKKVVSGYGHAQKQQIQFMMKHLFKLNQNPSEDAADALAVALCHARHRLNEKLGL